MKPGNDIENFFAGKTKLAHFDKQIAYDASEIQNKLTKPIGSLGRLEEFAIWLAGWQKKVHPVINYPQCIIFAGNHGISNKGVSAFSSDVTAQMVKNFETGGAAINQLCDLDNVKLSVKPIDLDKPTKDFSEQPAMKKKEVISAMQFGFDSIPNECDLLVLGEMGISNTTSATAISCVILNETPEVMAGIGTGLNKKQLSKKKLIIKKALKLHGKSFIDTIGILSCYGGREISALVGSLISARIKSIPVLLDGFVCTAAALSLTLYDKNILDHCLVSHLSTEPGHSKILKYLDKEPILNLKLRLGEGSGAAIATLILKAALETHNRMSTFEDAKVSPKIMT